MIRLRLYEVVVGAWALRQGDASGIARGRGLSSERAPRLS